MLTLVDAFSGWIEAFPMRSEIASEVTQFLIGEIIPRFGLPLSLQSDNGQWASFYHPNHWTGNPSLGITWKLHSPYRLQSLGKVEKANSILKTHLTKLSLELQRSWTKLLAMALTHIRTTFGEGNGNPLRCSCLENLRDEGAWWAAIYGVAQSQTWLKWLNSSRTTSREPCLSSVLLSSCMDVLFS